MFIFISILCNASHQLELFVCIDDNSLEVPKIITIVC